MTQSSLERNRKGAARNHRDNVTRQGYDLLVNPYPLLKTCTSHPTSRSSKICLGEDIDLRAQRVLCMYRGVDRQAGGESPQGGSISATEAPPSSGKKKFSALEPQYTRLLPVNNADLPISTPCEPLDEPVLHAAVVNTHVLLLTPGWDIVNACAGRVITRRFTLHTQMH